MSEPDSLFEHFIIAGLHPDVNLEAVEGAFVKRRKWEMDMINSGIVDLTLLQQRGPPIPTLEPQVDCITALVSTVIMNMFSTLSF